MATKGGTAVAQKSKARPLARIILEAPDATSLMRIYNLMKFRGADAGEFDFKSDFMAYKFFVEVRVEDLRKLCNSRLKELGAVAKHKLGEDAMMKAKACYEREYSAYAKKIVGTESFPKYLIKIRNGIAYFSNDPKTQRTLLHPHPTSWTREDEEGQEVKLKRSTRPQEARKPVAKQARKSKAKAKAKIKRKKI